MCVIVRFNAHGSSMAPSLSLSPNLPLSHSPSLPLSLASLCARLTHGLCGAEQRVSEVARAVLLGTCGAVVTRVSGLALADTDGANLKEALPRRPRKEDGMGGEKKGGDAGGQGAAGEVMKGEEVVRGLDLVDWGFVAGRAAWYKWGQLDLR